jgi:hypothetical protein
VQIVRRGEKIPAGTTGPIFICTRNDVLEGIIEDCPPERREDLVFLQVEIRVKDPHLIEWP